MSHITYDQYLILLDLLTEMAMSRNIISHLTDFPQIWNILRPKVLKCLIALIKIHLQI